MKHKVRQLAAMYEVPALLFQDEKERELDEKIKQLAAKYDIPEMLLKEVMALEKDRVSSNNRQLSPIIIRLIEQYTNPE